MKQKTIILIVLLIAIVGVIYYLEPESQYVPNQAEIELKDGTFPKAPELTGITGYLNVEEDIQLSDYKGKVVLIDFWTYTCINCIRTLPYLTSWDEKYRDDGLVIIGVHAPEFAFEKKRENVQNAIEKYDIKYPVVQDNDMLTWRAYQNRYWPAKYVVDKDGFIRYTHFGEGKYEETEHKIQELLAETGKDIEEETTQLPAKQRFQTTPELYAGYKLALPRGQNLANKEGLQPDKTITYMVPQEVPIDTIILNGTWQSNIDDLTAHDDGILLLIFTAAEVNIVADAPKPMEVDVFIGEKPITKEHAGKDVQFDGERAFILVDEPDLYNVVQGEYQRNLLSFRVHEGFSFNAFTFG
ncbi:TPA: thioredoxin family protein [Candidatus Woesearchaeota archaeon]|nr:thiol-disulfide isomerase [archaeon]HIJ10509.1 thioredoxin family protein [Candidatus Woesearchaeota archaeon]